MTAIDRENISIERDKNDIYELMNIRAKDNSLAVRFPALAIEWHPDKNGALTPENVPARSGRTVWWKCASCGFEWETSPANRTKADGGTGCPNCANSSAGMKNAIRSIEKNGSFKEWSDNNLLGALLLEEWDFEKNDAEYIFPEEIAPQSHKKVYWKCPYCGKERYTSPHYRVGSRRYCKCSNRGIIET